MAVDDGTKITIRVSNEDIQAMEDFMAENEIENRSDFVRDAIRAYIANSKTVGGEIDPNSIMVRFNPVVLQALENMKAEGIIFDSESYIRQLVMSDILPEETLRNSKSRAFNTAQLNNADL